MIQNKQGYGVFNSQVLSKSTFTELTERLDLLLVQGIPLKQGGRALIVHLQGDKSAFVVKQYRVIHRFYALKYRFKMLRTLRTWQYARVLTDADVSIIPIWGLWQQKNWLGPQQGFVIMPYQSGMTLKTFVEIYHQDLSRLTKIIQQTVTIYQQLARLRISHKDLKSTNFIVDEQDKVYLLDFDAATYHAKNSASRRAQMQDKARLLKNFKQFPAVVALFESELDAYHARS